ncbi:hypothetical protein HCJ59_05745 [Listeria sp. FSL L7-1515]|uniref:Uncharacterized protein n=1 Tax=Listeria immobilis TaxID=2713502 RepID=A0ABR6SVG2_9LIST|nr:hypothetical protein [Listeria immobilis]
MNSYLIEGHFDDHALNLVQFNHFQPLKYFVGTLILMLIGTIVLYFIFRFAFHHSENVLEVLILIVSFLFILVLIVLLIIFIHVPIFQAILSCLFVGGLVGCVFFFK